MAPGTWFTIGCAGGHAIIYWIPSAEKAPGGGANGRVLNLVIYGPAPDGLVTDRPGVIPPGEVPPAMKAQFDAFVDASFPPWWAALIHHAPSGSLSLRPVYDGDTSSYVPRSPGQPWPVTTSTSTATHRIRHPEADRSTVR